LPVCHPITNQTDFIATGESFPVNSLAYVLLYERYPSFHEGNTKDFKLVWKDSVLSDDNGSFRSSFPYEIKPGFTYQLIAVTDSNINILNQLYFNTIVAVDCFKVPAPVSACPGAPPQRMVSGLGGYMCAEVEHFDIYDAPGMSSSTIDVLTFGNHFLVVGEPQCADNQSWWQIETEWGAIGWLPEGDSVDSYSICPLP
jgi:hypothetical protein